MRRQRVGHHGPARGDRRDVRRRGRLGWRGLPDGVAPRRLKLDRPRRVRGDLAQLPNGELVGIADGTELAPRHGDVPARRAAAHRVQRVRALDLRLVVEQELGRVRFLLIYFTTGIVASAASYAFGATHGGRRRRVGGDLRDLRRVRHLQLPAAAPGDRRGAAAGRGHARRHQHGPRPVRSRASTGVPTSAGSSPGCSRGSRPRAWAAPRTAG